MTTNVKHPEINVKQPESGILARVESRSIDYVPHSERGGRLLDQSTIWFAGSAQLLSLATGAIGIHLGLNLGWTLIGLAIGTVLGTLPVAAHATQGPHLGLPQMIQSRPQFGRYGALAIWAMAIVVYWGYVVLGGNMLGTTAVQLGTPGVGVPAILTCAVAIVLAIFGYTWLHFAQRVITIVLVVILLVYVVGLISGGHLAGELFNLSGSFDLASFLVVVASATGYQLTWAFFVSDYSRYMPADTNKPLIIGFTAAGLIFGLFAFMSVGAISAALLPEAGIVAGVEITGGYVLPGLGTLILIAGGLGLLGLMAMCVYGGSLTLITALDSIRPVNPTRSLRLVTILLVGVTAAMASAVIPEDFLNTSFSVVLAVIGYLMAPWTSVNLTDFFLVRRGHYSVTEMFKKNGIYGNWNWRGIAAYVGTFLIMIPFMNLGFYEGPLAAALGGIDIAFFVGIPVGCILYWLLCRNMDLSREMAVVARSDMSLEEIAKPIE